MDTAIEYSASSDTWFDLLRDIRELEAAGLVAISLDEDAELRVQLTERGYAATGLPGESMNEAAPIVEPT